MVVKDIRTKYEKADSPGLCIKSDGTRDHCNIENVSVVIRFVQKSIPEEHLIGLIELNQLDAEYICNQINTCNGGQWNCQQKKCTSRCKIESGSFITTFDGKSYTVNGNCKFIIAMKLFISSKVKIQAQTTVFDSSVNVNTGYIFCYVTYSIITALIISFVVCLSDDVVIFWQSSQYVQVLTGFGMNLQVQVDPVMQLYVTLPEDAKGSTKGLCGTFNGIVTDEFMASNGIVELTADSFAKSWATLPGQCELVPPKPCIRSDNGNKVQ
ncbi:MUC6 protein, partial [Polypterus senegalus]